MSMLSQQVYPEIVLDNTYSIDWIIKYLVNFYLCHCSSQVSFNYLQIKNKHLYDIFSLPPERDIKSTTDPGSGGYEGDNETMAPPSFTK